MILKLLVDSGARKCKRVAPYGLKPSYYNQKFETGCDGHLCSPIKPKDLRKPKTWDKSLACWITGNDVKKQKNWTALQIWWKDKKETDQRGSRNADSNIKWLPLESIQSPCLHMHMCVCVCVCKMQKVYIILTLAPELINTLTQAMCPDRQASWRGVTWSMVTMLAG